ncbi:MAG: hypothetical protein AB8F74_17375 [Saprospiraceae bacterium]
MSDITHSKKVNPYSEQNQLAQLRQILLKEDRSELEQLRAVLQNKEQLSEKVSPIIQEHLTFLKDNFSTEYESIVSDMVSKKLEESQDDLLNVLYPVIGKMIKKFIGNEFQKLKDSIDQQIKGTFSKQGLAGRFSFFFRSKKTGEEVLASIDMTHIEEVFIIQKDSGLLMAHAATQQDANADVVAGMLTAIKAFVEDAFQRKQEELQMIEYGNYKIFIQSFHSYYMAAAISGSMSLAEREELEMKMFDFAENKLKGKMKMGLVQEDQQLSNALKESFLAEDSTVNN